MLLAPGVFGIAIKRTTDADLYGAFGIEQAFFNGASKRRAVCVLEAAEVTVPGVGVRVKVHHAQGAGLLNQRAHDRQRHQMVAANGQGRDARAADAVKKGFDAR